MMIVRSIALLGFGPALIAGCVSSHRIDYETFVRTDEPLPTRDRAASDEALAHDEANLANEARLPAIVRIALLRNPDALELEQRVHAAVARVPGAGRLPDLELKYEQWGVPLKRPYALDEADTLMVGLRQTFPAPGSLDAAERAAAEEARIALYTLRTRQLDLIAQVRRAYYAYHLADREYLIHREHAELTQRILELSRASFGSGGISQEDVLRIDLELRSLHRDLIAVERQKRSSAALLNALMGRPPGAPLGSTPELEASEVRTSAEELERIAERRRPEIAAAQHALERSQATLDRASREADWPSFMVGADYMYMPFAEAPHGYGAMASINLPWLNAKHDDEVNAAQSARAADDRARESVRVTVQFEVRDALARYQAALASYRLVAGELLASAQRSFESAQAAFAAGRGSGLGLLDALRSLLLVRLDQNRALVELASSTADLERAAGTDLEKAPLAQGPRP